MACKHTGTKVEALQLWAQSEGMPSWAFNWLATERSGFGGTKYNSAGVFAYPTFAAGIAATAATIEQTNMKHILAAFRKNSDLHAIYVAINSSPWCTTKHKDGSYGPCQNGLYPVALEEALTGGRTPAGGTRRGPTGLPPNSPYGKAGLPPPWDWSATVADAAAKLQARHPIRAGYAAAIRHIR